VPGQIALQRMPLGDEVDRYRLGEVRSPPPWWYRRCSAEPPPFTDEAADDMLMIDPVPFSSMPGQERLDRPEHAADIEVEGEAPLRIGGVEHAAVMDMARHN
jgi:hypothetical protein